MVQTEILVIENNNPDQLSMLCIIIVGIYLIFTVLGIVAKIKRKQQLENVKRLIVRRHRQMEEENII